MSTRSILRKWTIGLCLCLGAAGALNAQPTLNITISGTLGPLISGTDPLHLANTAFTATTSINPVGLPVITGTSYTYTGLTMNFSAGPLKIGCTGASATVSVMNPAVNGVGASMVLNNCVLLGAVPFTATLAFPPNSLVSPIPAAFSTVLVTTNNASQGTYTDVTPTTLGISGTTAAVCANCPAMSLTPPSLTFSGQAGGTPPPLQSVSIATGGTILDWASVVSTSSGGNWLSVNTKAGQTGGSFDVTANPSTLAAGTYTGSVKVYTAASNSPQTLNVTFNVTSPAFQLVPSPTSFTFNSVTGATTPTQPLSVTTSPSSSAPYTAAASTNDGNAWLSVSPTSGTTGGAPLTVAADASKVPTGGAYTGRVTLTATGATNSPLAVPVTFNVTKVAVSPGSMTFTTTAAGPNPPSQNLSVTSTGPSNISFTAAVTAGSSWLSLNTSSGTTNGAPLSVSVNNASLTAGNYNGTISITPAGASTPISVSVSLTVTSAPTMVPSPGSLTFSSNAGAVPNPQTINLTSTGGPISYNVAASTSTGGNWLSVSPGSGTTPGSVQVSINSSALAGLATGTYSGSVVFTATTNASNSPLSVPVTLNVSAALSPLPASLTFNYTINGTVPAAQPIAVTSNGGAIAYTATATTGTGGAWLLVTPGSATTPVGVSVSVNPASLAAGTYNGTVTLASSTASNSPVSVAVTLHVSAQPSITALPSSLTFAGQVGGANPAAQTISVGATTGTLNFSVSASTSSGGNWLSVSPGSGGTPGTLTVSVNTAGLASATYQGTITIGATGAANTPLVVPVTLTIGTNVLSALPSSLSFAYQIGSAQPAPQNISVASTGAVLSITAAPGASWLSAAPTAGSTPANLAVSVITTGLAAGTYNTSISISAANASNSPLLVPVTLTVTPAPALIVTPGTLSFSYQSGGSLPAGQSLAVSTNNGATASYSVSAVTGSGGNWLAVSPASGSTPASLMVALNQTALTSLAAGTYTGTVSVSASGFASQSVSVTLTVTKPKATILISGNLNFSFANTAAPQTSVIKISASDGSAHPFTAAIGAPAKWLTFVPTSGTTPGSITLTLNPAGLTPGTYFSTITISVSGTSDGTRTVTVQLTVPGSNLTVTPSTISFTFQPGGALPAAQSIAVAPSSGSAAVALTSVTANIPWLQVSKLSSAPGNITVTLSPGLLRPGSYVGNVYVTGVGSPGPSVSVAVSLTVNSMPQLTASPSSISFNYEIGGSVPAPQSIALSTDDVTLNYSVASPGTWLSVSPMRGTTPGTALVSVNPAGLGAGTYNGTINASAYGASNPAPIPVTLNVLGTGQQLVVTPSRVSFAVPVGGPAPAAQTLSVSSAGAAVAFTVTTTGAKWLAVTPASGSTPGSLSVAVNPAGLVDGTYTGAVTVAPTGLSGGGQVIPVTLKVGTGINTPTVSAIINAASGDTEKVAPGLIVAIFGQSLGPQTAATFVAPASGQNIATTLGGTRVLFDGVAAPILYAQDGQVNAIAPFELAGKATSSLEIEYNGVKSSATTLQVADAAPGLFTADGSGKGPGAILNQDFSLNTSSNPAAVGSAVMLYGTGGGQTEPASTNGQINPNSADVKLAQEVHVTIGGQAAQVLYYGAAPGLPGGVMQINAVIPDGTPPGNQPVVVQVGTVSTTQTVTVAVK